MTKRELRKLGWEYSDTWNDRMFYNLDTETPFSIFEYGGWGILDPFDKGFNLIYCDLTKKELKEFTNLARIYNKVVSNPEKYTLAAFSIARQGLGDFIEEMKERG